MCEVTASSMTVVNAKKKLLSGFFRKGIIIGLFSGFSYGLFSAFLALAMTKGVWGDWYGANKAGLSAFAIAYVVGALGCGVNDTCSAVWALIMAGCRGKLGDFFRCLNSKPGRMIMLAALMGGPIANSAYVIGLAAAGSIVVPISALCPAIGAILGRILYKQKLDKRMIFGIIICVSASAWIGISSMTGGAQKSAVVGIIAAIVAAIGWGIEGCIAGYSTAMVDSEIGITIRQTTSGLSNLIVFIPIIAIIGGSKGLAFSLTGQAFTSGTAMIWFAISGLSAYLSYMTWYKGSAMTGVALGMATNGTYSFFGPFCCWIILGVMFGIQGWTLTPIDWVCAILMAIGILIIAMNPMDLFRKKED
jgi:drug/metabolite transporter (DMT)-like permease